MLRAGWDTIRLPFFPEASRVMGLNRVVVVVTPPKLALTATPSLLPPPVSGRETPLPWVRICLCKYECMTNSLEQYGHLKSLREECVRRWS